MWYVMDRAFGWVGFIEFQEVEIEHRFFEYDRLTFHIPNIPDNRSLLTTGRLLYRPNTNKAYIIETLEYRTDNNQIWGVALGMESLLARRVVDKYFEYKGDVITAMNNLFNLLFSSNSNGIDRSIPYLVNTNNHPTGIISKQLDDGFEGDNFYELMVRLSEEFGFGYDIHYNYDAKKYEFQMKVGYGWYQNQSPKVIWAEKWGILQNQSLWLSNKYEKNVIYSASSDTTPYVMIVGNKTGWERKEMYEKGSVSMQDKTTTQLQKLLVSKGKSILNKQKKIKDLSFTLNETLVSGFGSDWNVGDKVIIQSDTFNVNETKTISLVNETIVDNFSTYKITFMEDEVNLT